MSLVAEGSLPGQVLLRRGWARATARPWNDEGAEIALALQRGSPGFLRECASHLAGTGPVFSPPLHRSGLSMWLEAGFTHHVSLSLMERNLADPIADPVTPVRAGVADWALILGIDRAAFDGFWRIGRLGLADAVEGPGRSVLLLSPDRPAGYAMAASSGRFAYLHRIAVDPARSGEGTGTSLLRAALAWAKAEGAMVMLLNVLPVNRRALTLYTREGFADTGSSLQILRFPASEMS